MAIGFVQCRGKSGNNIKSILFQVCPEERNIRSVKGPQSLPNLQSVNLGNYVRRQGLHPLVALERDLGIRGGVR